MRAPEHPEPYAVLTVFGGGEPIHLEFADADELARFAAKIVEASAAGARRYHLKRRAKRQAAMRAAAQWN